MRLACVITLGLVLILAPVANALTLEVAMARTLQNNPEIRQAKLQMEAAAGSRVVLRAAGLPDTRINVPAGVQGGKRSGENSVQPFAFGQGAFTQAIFNAALPAIFRRADIERLVAQQQLNVAITEQLHAARLAFYTAAYNDSLRALAEQQRQRLEANARAQSDRFEAGQAERQAVAIARVLEQEVTPRMEESRRASAGALLTLAQAMGADVRGALPTVAGDLAFEPVQIDVSAEASAALERRVDLKLARLLVRAAREDQRIAQAGYYPQISAAISGTYIPVSEIRRGSEGSARRSDDIVSSEARAGAAYTWRVVDNGLVTGAVLRQRALREANEAVLAKLEANVPRELQRIQNTLASLQSRHNALSKGSGVAEQTVRDIENNLGQGLASQLEYRTAETSFLQARAGLLAVAYEQNVALAERDRISGRYFQFSEGRGTVH